MPSIPTSPTPMNAEEAARRQSRTNLVEDLFRARPGAWISVSELAARGGFCGWRTRIADVRRRLKRAGEGDVDWNGTVRASAYRWVRVTREAPAPVLVASQQTLF